MRAQNISRPMGTTTTTTRFRAVLRKIGEFDANWRTCKSSP